ncbi:DUF6521 family protein [Halomonas pacifica]|uniref:three component ABC system middle component n=1 Tax=Bisbaumannia pacifica TaxID=77098 RepID=UPI00235839B6|nr:three component ABC system middle component [Halomonas pacifica]MDC8802224.1 DUF6521 family protein [Halomonas pacifica]
MIRGLPNMLSKSDFSEEELGLYNPAFVGFLLLSCLREFVAIKPSGMHCALAFLIVPMCLNRTISKNLPKTYKTPVGAWVASKEGDLSGLANQAEAFIPIVNMGLLFLLERRLIKINEAGCVVLGECKIAKSPALFNKSNYMSEALKAFRFMGKWFSHAPSTETIFAQLGIRP